MKASLTWFVSENKLGEYPCSLSFIVGIKIWFNLYFFV